MVNDILRIGIGLAGGAALLLILYGAFNTTISQGNPERIQQSQQIITSAIIGLVFIILSAALLHFIGIEILSLPGF